MRERKIGRRLWAVARRINSYRAVMKLIGYAENVEVAVHSSCHIKQGIWGYTQSRGHGSCQSQCQKRAEQRLLELLKRLRKMWLGWSLGITHYVNPLAELLICPNSDAETGHQTHMHFHRPASSRHLVELHSWIVTRDFLPCIIFNAFPLNATPYRSFEMRSLGMYDMAEGNKTSQSTHIDGVIKRHVQYIEDVWVHFLPAVGNRVPIMYVFPHPPDRLPPFAHLVIFFCQI